MVLEIPADIARRVSDSDFRLDLAVGMYASGDVTVSRGAHLCGLSHLQFQQELGRRQIPVHYGVADLRQDLANTESCGGLWS